MADKFDGDIPDFGDEDALREAFQRFLQGDETFDPAELMKAAGIDVNGPELKAMMQQLGSAFGSDGLLKTTASRDHAVSVASEGSTSPDSATSQALSSAANVATLWLGEVTSIAELAEAPVIATRTEWARRSLPVWEAISEPVATAIPRAVSGMMASQAPEALAETFASLSGQMEKVTHGLFHLQLAQVVGNLGKEVLSGGDIGIPLIHGSSEYDVQAMLVAQNMREFSADLDVPLEEADIYLAVREIAHARLFRHARWLRLHLMSAIRDFAAGISIDADSLMNLSEDFDPTDTEALTELFTSGALLPERTEEQNRALHRLETMLALIEGWVDHVTTLATTRLPKASSLAETIRRRRASGGPAERAFSTLVGLELRPRRLREASTLWAHITHALGPEARDALWRHPDSLPTDADLENPSDCVSRLSNPGAGDEMDQALQDLLEGEAES
jgi:putative hydrolase